MSLVKVINNPYDTERILKNLFMYCLKEDNSLNELEPGCILYGGMGVNLHSIDSIMHSMELHKKAYKKESGRRIHHFVISIYMVNNRYTLIPEKHTKCPYEICCAHMIAHDICEYLHYKGFQNAFFIHNDTNVVHIHFIFNSIDVNGNRLRNSRTFYDEILALLKREYFNLQWRDAVIYD